MTAGPQGGRFTGVPYTPGPVPIRPEVLTVQAKSVLDPTLGRIMLATVLVPGQQQWLIRRITVQGSAAVRCYVYVGSVTNANIVNGTNAGDFDEDDTNSPIFVDTGGQLNTVWLNTNPAGTALVRLEYNDVSG